MQMQIPLIHFSSFFILFFINPEAKQQHIYKLKNTLKVINKLLKYVGKRLIKEINMLNPYSDLFTVPLFAFSFMHLALCLDKWHPICVA